MAVLILLEDIPGLRAARRGLLKRLFAREDIPCQIREAGNKDDLDRIVNELQEDASMRNERIMLLCDVTMEYGVSATEDLRDFLIEKWSKLSTDWWGRTHIIVYTASDTEYDKLSKLPKQQHRVVLSQNEFSGKNKNEELKRAVSAWLHNRAP